MLFSTLCCESLFSNVTHHSIRQLQNSSAGEFYRIKTENNMPSLHSLLVCVNIHRHILTAPSNDFQSYYCSTCCGLFYIWKTTEAARGHANIPCKNMLRKSNASMATSNLHFCSSRDVQTCTGQVSTSLFMETLTDSTFREVCC